MRILVCLDQTAFSHSIVPAVQRLASAAKAEVELVTVVHREQVGGEPWSGQQPTPLAGPILDDARRALEASASQFSPKATVTVLAGPSASDSIVKHARLTHPDIIALATHSRGALGEMAVGGTAREVTRAGVAPVLLLHPLAATGMRTGDIPLGIYAFTSDGEQVGDVREVSPERIRIGTGAGQDVWLPASVVGAVTTGRLVLCISSAEVARIAQELSDSNGA